MNSLVDRELSQIAAFTEKDDASDPGLLQTASLMCRLFKSSSTILTNFRTGRASIYSNFCVQLQHRSLLANRFCGTRMSQKITKTTLSQTWAGNMAVWELPGRGVSVAFRGTQDALDLLADLDFEPQQLATATLPIYLHGGVYRAARTCCKEIIAKCRDLCCGGQEILPLVLTGKTVVVCKSSCNSSAAKTVTAGHSLGGALALCTFLILASEVPELRLPLAYGGVFTFGAPAVVHSSTDFRALTCLAKQLDTAVCNFST